MEKIGSKFIEFFVSNDFIKNEDKEIYKYALNIILSSLIHIATVMILGLCFNLLIESLVYYFAFIIIRKFAGGYHAKTPSKCYVFSLIAMISVLWLIKIFLFFHCGIIRQIIILIGLICVFIICVIAPLDTDNKLLNNKEKNIYRGVSIIIALVLLVISDTLFLFGFINIAISVLFGIYVSTLLLVIRKIQIKRIRTF